MVVRTSRPYKYKYFVLLYMIRCSIPVSIPVYWHVDRFPWSIHSHDDFHRLLKVFKEASAHRMIIQTFIQIGDVLEGKGRKGSVKGL